jgi:large subunit ribosomal protein L9
MEKIQVILKEDVPNLGRSGELVSVKAGYGRNYLIPQGLALAATRKNVAQMDHHKKQIEAQASKVRKDAEGIASNLNGASVVIERQVGEENKLFGSVTARDVEEALAAKGLKVDRRKIVVGDPIKALGDYNVEIKIARDVTAHVKVTVAAKPSS